MTVEDAETGDEARRPAPGRLRAVQEFCNSVDFEGGWDELADADGLATWLTANGHPVHRDDLGPADVRRALRFREALRDLLTVPTTGTASARGRATLAEDAIDLPLTVVFDGTISFTPVRAGLDGALASLLATLALTDADGTLARLKVCQSDTCRWLFYDQSRNGSSRWCTMRLCGARSKNRSYRRRLREGAN